MKSVRNKILEAFNSDISEYETIYRGEGQHNKNGYYWTNDKDYARQFTQSGLDREIRTAKIKISDIYVTNPLPEATNEDQIDTAIKIARSKNYKAIRVKEGSGEPNSLFIFNKTAIRPL